MCEKALADFMESKRRAFPRFYFVSTQDLLDILSNGNNPVKVRRRVDQLLVDLQIGWLAYRYLWIVAIITASRLALVAGCSKGPFRAVQAAHNALAGWVAYHHQDLLRTSMQRLSSSDYAVSAWNKVSL